jgi:hypothetical protein
MKDEMHERELGKMMLMARNGDKCTWSTDDPVKIDMQSGIINVKQLLAEFKAHTHAIVITARKNKNGLHKDTMKEGCWN